MARNDGLSVEPSVINDKNPEQRRYYHNHQKIYLEREFIAWDGEGIHVGSDTSQPYVLWGNSKGDRLVGDISGLSTWECFDLLLRSKQKNPDAINIIYAGTYDANQMLCDVPWRKVTTLYANNTVNWRGYRIEWYPGKWLRIKRYSDQCSVRLFDVFGFFQSSFLDACKKFLGENDPEYGALAEGKSARDSFSYDQLETFILPYWEGELRLLVRMAETLRADLEEAGLRLASWHGPGAIATQVFKRYNIKAALDQNIRPEIVEASQYAYSAGRIENYQVGFYDGSVWEYDINSAYPAVIAGLPNLMQGYWEMVYRYEPNSFGVWFVDFDGHTSVRRSYIEPQPLFRRAKNGSISYPPSVKGWYWSPEAGLCNPSAILCGWVFRHDGTLPFDFIRELYETRQQWKLEGNTAERALKLALNSLYGKTAQRVGGNRDRIPPFHQLEWAGYVTSATRARMYNAMQSSPDSIISVETDALFTTNPLPLKINAELGGWKETKHDSICYLQNGLYYVTTQGKTIAKYRGLDKDRETGFPKRLPYRKVLDSLALLGRYGGDLPPLPSTSTRYVGIGQALHTHSVWRSWETSRRLVHIGGSGKRSHLTHLCPTCQADDPEARSWYGNFHYCTCTDLGGKSYKHPLPWIEEGDSDLHEFIREERWQPQETP
jgi:hypothetical protein